jgi:very-short-patch-repair endonuclease
MTLLCWPPDLERIPRSGVRVLGAPEVGDALTRIEAHARVRPLARRVVVRHWEWLPDLDQLLDEALAALAASAACLWPAWYGREDVDGRPGSPSLVRAADRRTLSEIGAEIPELSTAWAELAFPRCRAGVAPTVHALPRAIQAEQLALALDPQGVLLVLACTDADPPEERVLALAKAAEWLAREARARVALLVPLPLLDRAVLEPLLYRAVRLVDDRAPLRGEEPATEPTEVRVFPVLGRPHPLSPGEQRLAALLAQDGELGGLFTCNQRVRTVRGTEPLVDLHWAAGRLVVEIDGYRGHSEPWAFRADRQRDYELLASGYRVLRVTHDEVMADAELALEKIRDVVRLCRPSTP